MIRIYVTIVTYTTSCMPRQISTQNVGRQRHTIDHQKTLCCDKHHNCLFVTPPARRRREPCLPVFDPEAEPRTQTQWAGRVRNDFLIADTSTRKSPISQKTPTRSVF